MIGGATAPRTLCISSCTRLSRISRGGRMSPRTFARIARNRVSPCSSSSSRRDFDSPCVERLILNRQPKVPTPDYQPHRPYSARPSPPQEAPPGIFVITDSYFAQWHPSPTMSPPALRFAPLASGPKRTRERAPTAGAARASMRWRRILFLPPRNKDRTAVVGIDETSAATAGAQAVARSA
jgi:hypothetical protein